MTKLKKRSRSNGKEKKAETYFPPNVLASILSNLRVQEIGRMACISKFWWGVSYMVIKKKRAQLDWAWEHGVVQPTVIDSGLPETACCYDFWAKGNLVVLAGENILRIHNIDTNQKMELASEDPGSCMNRTFRVVCFLDDTLVSGDDRGNICGWDCCSGKQLFSVVAHDVVSGLIKDGESLVSSGSDSSIKIWNKPRRRGWVARKVLIGHKKEVNELNLSPDRKQLVSGSDDNTIRLWSMASGNCLKVITGCTDRVWGVQFFGDGQLLSGHSNDNVVLTLWDLATEEVKGTLTSYLISTYDGSSGLIVAGYEDGSIKIRKDLNSGSCIRELQSDLSIWSVQSDIDRVIAISHTSKIMVWDFAKCVLP